jgi:hypothetical protein
MMTTKNPSKELIALIRHHDAISVITPSASRQLVRKGDIRRVRDFLDKLNIESFAKPRKFLRSLDRGTKSLARRIPKGGWGAARKFLNLYLRRITYNFYLRLAYRPDRIEPLLELPMDSYAAKGVKGDYESRLPRWKGVSHLTPEVNAFYQAAAKQIAETSSIDRVHLDMKYWRAKNQARRKRKSR